MSSDSNPFTLNEWIAFIQQDPEQANQQAVWLQEQIKKQGIMIDPAFEISIENYDRAQHVLSKAANEPQQAERIARMAAVGRVTLGEYPSREGWLELIQTNPTFAQLVYYELKAKQALLGLQTPPTIKSSIETYHSIITEQQK